MSTFAKIDKNNIVTQVIVAEQEFIDSGAVGDSSKWIETFDSNYAGIGFTYNVENNIFISPQPYDSWILDENTYLWKAPVAMPDDGEVYNWNEGIQNWEIRQISNN